MKRGVPVAIVLVCASLTIAAGEAGAKPRGTSVSVTVEPGRAPSVSRALRARGLRVDRRAGRRLQVVVRHPRQRGAIARIPGVAGVATPPSAYGDAVTSQGVERTGASALRDIADDGAGLRIAILDLGFGVSVPALQDQGELPPPSRLVQQSFDPAVGIAGTNAYGNPTDHGELVAQTVYDFAPRAHYLFVNYHTPDDFLAAVGWLIDQRVDMVVHSNNFLDGPFDGTSPAAHAVDRAADAGILWFNSAGNYGEKHWAGPWRDADDDGVHEWPGPADWTFTHAAGEALTFHLWWDNPPGAEPADVDLMLERRRPDGGWDIVARSQERQREGAPASERINGHRPLEPGSYRLRAELVAGPAPGGDLTLFSREDDLIGLGGTTGGSVPTPADARGSISVGALDWRSNSLVRYSSRGPTADGRRKPDLTAPTGTTLARPGGDPRDVGGTSIAAPNAAGATALALGALRAAGIGPSTGEIRAMLAADAIDLGDPGPDSTFGAGRVRVDTEAPVLRPVAAPPRRPFRGDVRVSVEATDAGALATWALLVDGRRVRVGRTAREVINARVPTRTMADGRHRIGLEVGDAVGNVDRRVWEVVTDNTAPRLALAEVEVLGAPVAASVAQPARLRGVRVSIDVDDTVAASTAVTASLRRPRDGLQVIRRLSVPNGTGRRLIVGRVPPGIYVLRMSVADAAGNVTHVRQGVRVPR